MMSSSCNDIIDTLSHRQLQEECRDANLSAGGSSQVLRRRLRGWKNMQSNKSRKKQKTSSPADDLVCPITMELPFDPVVAEDGRIYEQSAIQRHFVSKRVSGIKSPVSNEPMGQRLIPSPQIKSHIQTLVETGVIEGNLAEHWKGKQQQKEEVEKLLQSAQDGDVDDMFKVGRNYLLGKSGFEQNPGLCYKWFDKAHKRGHVEATKCVGLWFLHGNGEVTPARNEVMGIALLASAAGRGSVESSFELGRYFSKGEHGLQIDTAQAKYWFEKGLSCDRTVLNEDQKSEARAELQKIENAMRQESGDISD